MAEFEVNRLRTERQRRGWTQDDLAEKAGLHQPEVSGYERGVWPGKESATRLADAFGVPVDVVYRWLLEPAEEVA